MKEKLCCLVIGHSFNKQGTHSGTMPLVTEYFFNAELAEKIKERFHEEYPSKKLKIRIIHRETYSSLPEKVNFYKPDFTVSLHANSYNRNVSGSEVLYYGDNPVTIKIANVFNDQFKKMMLRNRGIKRISWYNKGAYLLRKTKSHTIIAEPFFIDSETDLFYVRSNYKFLVELYVRAIYKSFELF